MAGFENSERISTKASSDCIFVVNIGCEDRIYSKPYNGKSRLVVQILQT